MAGGGAESAIDPPHQSGKNLARAHLHKMGSAAGGHGPDALGPQDRLRQLVHQSVTHLIVRESELLGLIEG